MKCICKPGAALLGCIGPPETWLCHRGGRTELTDEDGTRWVYDPVANTYQPIAPDGDASVPMPAIVFASVYPELYVQFWPKEPR